MLACFDEIKMLIVDRDIDILCISETWLDSNVPDDFVNIEGYNLFRCDGGRGGGACMYVRNDLRSVRMEIHLPPCEGIEDVWVKVQLRKLPTIIIGAMYRHPHALINAYDYIRDILQLVSLENKKLFLLGDLNDDQLICQSKLLKIVNTMNLVQVINEPTRITPTSKTLLDVVITNAHEIISGSEVTASHLSDHEQISVEIDVRKPKRKPEVKTFRSLKNYNQNILCNKLLDKVPILNQILNTDDVDKQVDILTSTFGLCLNSCAPIKTQTITRPPAPWMTEEIKEESKNRNCLRKRFEITKDEATFEQYKKLKNHVRSLIRTAKANHYKCKFTKCKKDKSDIWNLIRDIVPCKSTATRNVNVIDPLESAETLNNFFANVGKNVFEEVRRLNTANRVISGSSSCSAQVKNNKFHRRFRPNPVSVETIINIITKLKNKNSCGVDGINSRFLKDSLPVLAFYITIIVNTSIITGIVPSLWKYGIICPAFKKGDNEDPSNYRPISLLCILSKVLERVVADQLYEYMTENELFSNSQHGFRKHLSTQTALTQITDQLYNDIDKNKISLLALCDLSKAFDSVSSRMTFY